MYFTCSSYEHFCLYLTYISSVFHHNFHTNFYLYLPAVPMKTIIFILPAVSIGLFSGFNINILLLIGNFIKTMVLDINVNVKSNYRFCEWKNLLISPTFPLKTFICFSVQFTCSSYEHNSLNVTCSSYEKIPYFQVQKDFTWLEHVRKTMG